MVQWFGVLVPSSNSSNSSSHLVGHTVAASSTPTPPTNIDVLHQDLDLKNSSHNILNSYLILVGRFSPMGGGDLALMGEFSSVVALQLHKLVT